MEHDFDCFRLVSALPDNQPLESLNHFSESTVTVLGNGSLAVRLSGNSYEDNYTCTANNGIGKQLSKTVSLKVHSKPAKRAHGVRVGSD